MNLLDISKRGRDILTRNFNDVPTPKVTPQYPIGYLLGDDFNEACKVGYVSINNNPEVITACRKIAELISTMTIYLMSNTEKGDVRIQNELSKTIDINPMPNMTRKTWIEGIVMNMLLYGKGNAIVRPHTYKGYIQYLEPIASYRVGFEAIDNRRYKVLIDGVPKSPDNLLHFVHNPDEVYLWKGKGLNVYLKDLARNLAQAQKTENAFMSSEWKPSLIVKVDSMIKEFGTPEGREKILKNYAQSMEAGQPWLVPSEQFEVEQVKPLSLADLAIKDTVELDKKTVASIIGVPAFILGVGDYKQSEWNNFIQNTIRPIALEIQQELTKKLIISPKWYFKFNTLSLLEWDMQTLGNVLGSLYDRGVIMGNEIRDRLGYDPLDGLDELHVLENYIPIDKIGDQGKLQNDNQSSEEG